jgi:hypothetical protein
MGDSDKDRMSANDLHGALMKQADFAFNSFNGATQLRVEDLAWILGRGRIGDAVRVWQLSPALTVGANRYGGRHSGSSLLLASRNMEGEQKRQGQRRTISLFKR